MGTLLTRRTVLHGDDIVGSRYHEIVDAGGFLV
jgi:hypothetical protein